MDRRKSSVGGALQVVARLLTIPLSALVFFFAGIFLLEDDSRYALPCFRALLVSSALITLSGMSGKFCFLLVGMMMVGWVFVVAPSFPPGATDIVTVGVVVAVGCTACFRICTAPHTSSPPYCDDGGSGGSGFSDDAYVLANDDVVPLSDGGGGGCDGGGGGGCCDSNNND